jgi:hypothetical protein
LGELPFKGREIPVPDILFNWVDVIDGSVAATDLVETTEGTSAAEEGRGVLPRVAEAKGFGPNRVMKNRSEVVGADCGVR